MIQVLNVATHEVVGVVDGRRVVPGNPQRSELQRERGDEAIGPIHALRPRAQINDQHVPARREHVPGFPVIDEKRLPLRHLLGRRIDVDDVAKPLGEACQLVFETDQAVIRFLLESILHGPHETRSRPTTRRRGRSDRAGRGAARRFRGPRRLTACCSGSPRSGTKDTPSRAWQPFAAG